MDGASAFTVASRPRAAPARTWPPTSSAMHRFDLPTSQVLDLVTSSGSAFEEIEWEAFRLPNGVGLRDPVTPRAVVFLVSRDFVNGAIYKKKTGELTKGKKSTLTMARR